MTLLHKCLHLVLRAFHENLFNDRTGSNVCNNFVFAIACQVFRKRQFRQFLQLHCTRSEKQFLPPLRRLYFHLCVFVC